MERKGKDGIGWESAKMKLTFPAPAGPITRTPNLLIVNVNVGGDSVCNVNT